MRRYDVSPAMPLSHRQLRQLEEASQRLCERYVREVVVRFKLCPWALPAIRENRIKIAVITDDFSSKAAPDAAAERLLDVTARVPLRVELVLVVLPRWTRSRLDMDALLRAFRREHEVSTSTQGEPTFAAAAFHPEATLDTSSPEAAIPYARRSPDPLVQLVRTEALRDLSPRDEGTAFFSLTHLHSSSFDTTNPTSESLRARVARANLETMQRQRETFEAVVHDLIEERNELHRRILAWSAGCPPEATG